MPVPTPTTPSSTPTPSAPENTGSAQLRVTDAPAEAVFSLRVTLAAVEGHQAQGDGWVTILPGPVEVDLVGVSGIEQVLGEARLQPGKYTEVRLQVAKASVTVGTESI
ncbi:MAG: DUF4382 domain-containing protein, partial [Chloroflexi bacterium]|nr:DUF4382 domain-containing protein [Chloroflexota bacterium]